jgi:hypothetical protein
LTGSLWKLTEVLRDEVAWVWVKPNRRQDVTDAIYQKDSGYVAGGKYFQQGFFDWEKKLLQTPFPSSGKILVGGAGGGREVLALLKRRYDVWAFDPADFLAQALDQLQADHENFVGWKESYKEFVSSYASDRRKFFQDRRLSSIDGVILGWGSFSHVLDSETRENLLKTLRELAPKAPVIISFLTRSEAQTSRWDRTRPFLQRAFRLLGASGRRQEGDVFYPGSGFVHLFSLNEIDELARFSGYEVVSIEKSPYPHALLLPK